MWNQTRRRNAGNVRGDDFSSALLNSLTVAIPSTVIPILIAAFAAYGFAWMNFPGKGFWFALVVALLVVPLQIALVPVLRDFASLHLNGTFLGIWLAHTGFGLPLATFLLYSYIRALPRETLESAFIDGASHFTVFTP
jgi:alpha-glucoside transport system permease protein